MPLPNYGYENQEKKTHQDLVFEMAPEIVSDDENGVVNGKKVKNLRGKVTTGKIGIDLERTLKINEEKDPNVWKTVVDPKDIEDAKKYSAPERKALKADVKKGLSSLISSSKARNIRDSKRPTLADSLPARPSAETQKNLRFSLPDSCRQKEESIIAVSIQPSGTYSRSSGSVSSASPRSTPDPTEAVNITRRVDPRYHAPAAPPTRHSLSQAFHEKNKRTESSGLTMSEVTVQRSVKSLVSRGIN